MTSTGEGEVDCVADVRAVLGEGPLWAHPEQALYWIDIPQKRLLRWREGEGAGAIDLPVHLCSIAMQAGGGFVGAGYDGFYQIDLDRKLFMPIGDPEADLPHNRFNDGKVDPAGRFWAGTMDQQEREASGSLYRLDPDRSWTRVDTGYRVTNGPAFSGDGRAMYHADSARQVVYAFDIAADGGVHNRRVHLRFGEDEGYPDGMTVDAQDCLWIAFWDGWCVRRFAPDGTPLQRIDMPVQRPTSVAFGGAGLDQLFVTSARRDLTPAEAAVQPLAGGLFMTRPGVTGRAEPLFAG